MTPPPPLPSLEEGVVKANENPLLHPQHYRILKPNRLFSIHRLYDQIKTHGVGDILDDHQVGIRIVLEALGNIIPISGKTRP